MKTKIQLVPMLMCVAMALNSKAQISGSGTSGYIPKFTGTSSIGNSVTPIYENGTGVGIGTTSPGFKLDVNGDINIASGNSYKSAGATIIVAGGGSNKDFFGESAGASITSGLNNAYYGYSAGWKNTTGYYNTCIGQWANGYNTSGSANTVIGYQSSYYSGSGGNNTICGKEAGFGVYNASPYSYFNNSFFGCQAGYGMTTGASNVFTGYQAGYSNTTASYNIFTGSQSGYSNTTGGNNVFTGYQAGYSNTSASNNIFSGYQSGYFNTTGYNNISIGSSSNYTNSTSSHNVAAGVSALYKNTGAANIGMGTTALYNNTGSYNMGIGFQSLYYNTTSGYNTAAGYQSLFATTGGYNTAFGFSAGSTNTSGTYNTLIGYAADVSTTGLTNATAIGNGAVVNASNKVRIGNTYSTIVIEGQTAWTYPSDGRFKKNITETVKGLEFIKELRPVHYNFDSQGFDQFLMQHMSDSAKTARTAGVDYSQSSSIKHIGFIAQEVEQAANDCGFVFDGVHIPVNEDDNYSLGYAQFVVPLVKAVQELSITNDSLKAQNTKQDSINAALTKNDSIKTAQLQAIQNQLDQLTSVINSCCAAGSTKSLQLNDGGTSSSTVNSKNVELSNRNIVVLDQNSPNPFADQTVITYYLPEGTGRAQMLFLDQSGKLVKTVELTEKGNGRLNVFASDLTNGVYTYSLIVDGKTMETKKMVKQ